MKKLYITIFMLLPVSAIAQDVNQQDMMAQMQKFSVCMASIDQNEMKALENDTTQFEAKMHALCKEGKREEAQESAIDFSKKMMHSATVKAMQKCSEKMSASVKRMMPDMNPEEIAQDYNQHHVCDEI